MAQKDDSIKTTVRLPRDLVKAARHWAVDHECDFQDAVRVALEQLVAKKGGR